MLSLKEFLDASVVNFWAIDTICHQLYYEGFQFLDARKQWDLVPGGKYYTLQNGTAVIAFIVPDSGDKKLHAPRPLPHHQRPQRLSRISCQTQMRDAWRRSYAAPQYRSLWRPYIVHLV